MALAVFERHEPGLDDGLRETLLRTPAIRRPPTALLALEEARALGELGTTRALMPLLRRVGRGDGQPGHPVIVFPGFIGGDRSTRLLRSILREWGYRAFGWRLGVNVGPTDRILDGMTARVADLCRRHRDCKLTLIGHSLGGVYARRLARAEPDLVREVITLGTPFYVQEGDLTHASLLYRMLTPLHSARFLGWQGQEQVPLTVPMTSIFTRTDGVVPWRTCLEHAGPRRQNIEVWGSHCGLPHNAAVLLAIASRLGQPDGEWSPFQPDASSAFLYPPQRR